MPALIDLKGQVFGRLTVLSRVSATGQSRWFCRCECGKTTIAAGYDLREALTKSCGCGRSESATTRNTTHGKTGTKEYRAWINMRNRCSRPNVSDYPRYGGAGIKVCSRWRDSFETFYSDLGPCPKGYSLDRINGAGNYEPSNCRWAPLALQANNKRRVKVATIKGVTKSISEWCKALGLPHRTVRARIYELGWVPEDALTTPIRKLSRI